MRWSWCKSHELLRAAMERVGRVQEGGLRAPTLLHVDALPRGLVCPLPRNGLIRFSCCFFRSLPYAFFFLKYNLRS